MVHTCARVEEVGSWSVVEGLSCFINKVFSLSYKCCPSVAQVGFSEEMHLSTRYATSRG